MNNYTLNLTKVTCTNCDWTGEQHELGESYNGDVLDCNYCLNCKTEEYLKGVE